MTTPGDTESLPPLWRAERRRHLVGLVLVGLGQAACIGAGAHLVIRAIAGSTSGASLAVALLVAAAVLGGLLQLMERVLVERLSQSYVHEIRVELVRRNLAPAGTSTLGVAMARATNDLTSIRSWISLGVGPLIATAPLILGATIALLFVWPLLAVGVVAPLALLSLCVGVLSRHLFARARELRRVRGRLSWHLADTFVAADSIRSAGGSRRELRRIEARSSDLVDAAVARARYAGAVRGSAAAAAGLISAAVVLIGLLTHAPAPTLVAGLSVAGFLASPVRDLGRAAEYRQTYRAARRKIGPAVQRVAEQRPHESLPELSLTELDGCVAIVGLAIVGVTPSDRTLPDLVARPGERILLDLGDELAESRLLGQLVAIEPLTTGHVIVAGRDLCGAGERRMREKIGYAARGMHVGRASIARAVRYRVPNAPMDDVDRQLRRVALDARVRDLPKGALTLLRHGGAPLTISERALLALGRASFGDPPLLILDRLDTELDPRHEPVLRDLVDAYPGVVVMATSDPDLRGLATRRWRAATEPIATEPTATEPAATEPAATEPDGSGVSVGRPLPVRS